MRCTPAGFADGTFKHRLKTGDVGGEVIACADKLEAVFTELFCPSFVLQQVIEAGGKTVYRTAVTGFASRADAAAFCSALKAGGKDCFVR